MNHNYKSFKNLGPGFSIRRDMEANDWNQKDLANILGYSEKHISRLLNNKEPITIKTGISLSAALGSSPQFWINLDTNYRLRLEDTAKEQATAAKALIYRYMPVRDMRAKNWLPQENSKLIEAVKKFWGIKKLKFDFLEKDPVVCFRKSELLEQFNPYYAATWFHKAKMEACKEQADLFSAEKLTTLATKIPQISTIEDGVEYFIAELKKTGVKFLQLPHLEKTYIDGASFLDGNNPVIVYTARHNRIDNFWFTITHEIAHVLKHLQSSQSIIIDNMDIVDTTNKMEVEADLFSAKILKMKEILKYFNGMKRKSKLKIMQCSAMLNIAPCIIIGCLQHHKEMPYSSMRDMLKTVCMEK
ncbi:MAG: helix-turn-helix domain-containing protein [Lentisphaeria bacterium]